VKRELAALAAGAVAGCVLRSEAQRRREQARARRELVLRRELRAGDWLLAAATAVLARLDVTEEPKSLTVISRGPDRVLRAYTCARGSGAVVVSVSKAGAA
jgi:hypothetical protein